MNSTNTDLKSGYENDLNHQQWLATVSEEFRPIVPSVIAAWDAQADVFNQWSALGWDERDDLMQKHVATHINRAIATSNNEKTKTLSEPPRQGNVYEQSTMFAKTVPNPVAFPRVTLNGRVCVAYPAKPDSVLLRFEDGSDQVIPLSEFRALPRDTHVIFRDEYWDLFGGRAAQNEIEDYLYGPRE